MKANLWGDRVTIVFSDMRTWKAPEKADILVSELLGSFGDNELSPECLDGAQKFLKPEGISIPADYTAFVAPMASNKLHADVSAFKDMAHFETSYVVMFKAISLLAQPKPIWTFEHPNWTDIPMNQGTLPLSTIFLCTCRLGFVLGRFPTNFSIHCDLSCMIRSIEQSP